MKKLALLALSLLIISGCKKEEPKPDHRIQDHTSFIFWHDTPNRTYPNCVVGYYTPDGLCHKLAELGDLKTNQRSKEITVDKVYPEIYLFTDYFSPRRFKTSFKLRKNYKNIFLINDTAIDVSKQDPYSYPH